ncbi:flagellar basal body rod protein FlgB [Candidatus Poribacteria bacterium]
MLFDKTSEALTAATHYAGLRHKIIANNIANVDTPDYKALDISFRQQLEDFMERGSRAGPPGPPMLMFAHDLNGPGPRMDHNTVSIDQELTKLSQNAIFHNVCLQLLNSKNRILKSALTS